MNQGKGNYVQNLHQNLSDNYENCYVNEFGGLEQNYASLNLEVPNARLYTENVPNFEETHTRNLPFYQFSQPLDLPNTPARYSSSTVPIDCYNTNYQKKFQNPQTQATTFAQAKSKFSHIQYDERYYPSDNTSSYYEEYFLPQENINTTNNCKYCEYENYYPEVSHQQNLQRVHGQQNPLKFAKEAEYYVNDAKRKFYEYGRKVQKGTKKYPVTVKMPKFVSRNSNPTTLSKRPSALCLPRVTQLDPALIKRKSKTNQQIKKNNNCQSEMFSSNDAYNNINPYPAHKINSQGDVKHLDETENLINTFENESDEYIGESTDFEDKEKLKQLTKFLKPRVPSSMRFRQDQQVPSPANVPPKSYQPRIKLSLDRLLNRLQKCETIDDLGELSEESKVDTGSTKDNKNDDSKETNNEKIKSFNYEELSRKCPASQEIDKKNSPSRSSSGSFQNKKFIKSMDDNCALDLHRSKSYIVDLIDKALSKELGTVPRDQTNHHGLNPNKAIATISRHHHQSKPKELCYELTTALTDSFISNATAPPKKESNRIIQKSTSDGQIKESNSYDDCYIKQLKQLRWGHIRHIQHEARKLADLEEFLEKCGETEL